MACVASAELAKRAVPQRRDSPFGNISTSTRSKPEPPLGMWRWMWSFSARQVVAGTGFPQHRPTAPPLPAARGSVVAAARSHRRPR